MAKGRYMCGHPGCDFSAANLGELLVHNVTTHPFAEARTAGTVPASQLQELCGRIGGHVASSVDPSKCGTCGVHLATPAAHDVATGHPNPEPAGREQPRRSTFLPLTLDMAKVCGACGKTGPNDFLGDVRWARLDVTGCFEGEQDLQAVLYVPLHVNALCASQDGCSDALVRLLTHVAVPRTLHVSAVLPDIEKPKGGSRG